MTSFSKLGVDPAILKALEENKITVPTEVQKQVIPKLLKSNGDFVGQAHTGTGKTAAYGIPALQKLDANNKAIQVLILAPTRELVQQIGQSLFRFTKYVSPRIFTESVFGGSDINQQISRLKRPSQVLIATPGRLVDLLDRRAVNLDQVQTLILDEADEMLKMGFKKDLDIIFRQSSSQRKTWLFSATIPFEIKSLIQIYLHEKAPHVKIESESRINTQIDHEFIMCLDRDKTDTLKAYLIDRKGQRGIVFCRTKNDTNLLTKKLADFPIKVNGIHGDMDQTEREKVLRAFRKERIDAMVATDVVARGIDIADLDYVVHLSLPENVDFYTHRSGRTARAGKTGKSVVIAFPDEHRKMKQIEEKLEIDFEETKLQTRIEKVKVEASGNMCTVYMNLGTWDGFNNFRMIQFILREAGLADNELGTIEVERNKSVIRIDYAFLGQLTKNLHGLRENRKKIKISQSLEEANAWKRGKGWAHGSGNNNQMS